MNSRYKINDGDIIYEIIDGEVILLNLTNGNYFSLDHIGLLIWELITRNCQLNVLLEAIKQFDDNFNGITEASLNELLTQMKQEGLIEPCDGFNAIENEAITGDILSRLKDGSVRLEIPVLHAYKDIQEKYAHPAGVKKI